MAVVKLDPTLVIFSFSPVAVVQFMVEKSNILRFCFYIIFWVYINSG